VAADSLVSVRMAALSVAAWIARRTVAMGRKVSGCGFGDGDRDVVPRLELPGQRRMRLPRVSLEAGDRAAGVDRVDVLEVVSVSDACRRCSRRRWTCPRR
jgi:hypothetical protein